MTFFAEIRPKSATIRPQLIGLSTPSGYNIWDILKKYLITCPLSMRGYIEVKKERKKEQN